MAKQNKKSVVFKTSPNANFLKSRASERVIYKSKHLFLDWFPCLLNEVMTKKARL